MKRTPIHISLDTYPREFHPFLKGAPIWDSSCSPEARVIYIGKDRGYYLKSAPEGTLRTEALLTEYFHRKGLSAPVLSYLSEARKDWLLTERVPGEDATYGTYVSDPKRLCDAIATQLRLLHETDYSDCPVQNRTETYLNNARKNYSEGHYDTTLFPDNWGYATAEEAWSVLEREGHLLRTDTLLHGDYCLPNILFDDWRFTGFIDLGGAGVGDRHVDLFWGAWTLQFNLHTDAYTDRFFDAYGRDRIEPDTFRIVRAAEVFG